MTLSNQLRVSVRLVLVYAAPGAALISAQSQFVYVNLLTDDQRQLPIDMSQYKLKINLLDGKSDLIIEWKPKPNRRQRRKSAWQNAR